MFKIFLLILITCFIVGVLISDKIILYRGVLIFIFDKFRYIKAEVLVDDILFLIGSNKPEVYNTGYYCGIVLLLIFLYMFAEFLIVTLGNKMILNILLFLLISFYFGFGRSDYYYMCYYHYYFCYLEYFMILILTINIMIFFVKISGKEISDYTIIIKKPYK